MVTKTHYLLILPISLLLAFLSFILFPCDVFAQSDITHINISSIDTTAFPEIHAHVVLETNNGQSVKDIHESDLEVLENGHPVDFQIDEQLVGVKAILFIDGSSSIKLLGLTGKPRIEECKDAILRFARMHLEDGIDWVAIVAIEKEGLVVVQDLTANTRKIRTSLDRYTFQAIERYTPLFDTLSEAFDLLDDAPLDTVEMQEVVIVFSDGFDVISDLELKGVVSSANQRNISIYTVLLGPNELQNRENLETLAELTQGTYAHLSSLHAVDRVFSRVVQDRYQHTISYTSQINQTGAQNLTIKSTDPPHFSSEEKTFSIVIQSPDIDLIIPNHNITLTHSVPAWVKTWLHPDVLSDTLTQSVDVEITWPNGQDRDILRADLIVNGDTVDSISNPQQRFSLQWDIALYQKQSEYQLDIFVRLYDELGIETESRVKRINVQVAPQSFSWKFIISIAGGLGLTIFLILAIAKKRARESRVSTPQQSKAWLEIVKGREMGKRIPLTSASTTIECRLGQLEVVSHSHTSGDRIDSTYPLTILNRDGRFYLLNESSASEIFLNDEDLPICDNIEIIDEDEISFACAEYGRVRLCLHT